MPAIGQKAANMAVEIVEAISAEWKQTSGEEWGNEVINKMVEKVKQIITQKKEKKPRKKRDKNAPKRSMSAYGFFCKGKRSELAKDYKNDPRNLMKALGEAWKEAKNGDVGEWEKMAEDDKERYEKEMENYNPPSDEEIQAQYKKKGKKNKDPSKPKRACSEYIRFCSIMRPKLGELSKKQLTELYGENIDNIDEIKGSQKTKILGALWSKFKESREDSSVDCFIEKKEAKKIMKKIEKEYKVDKERYEEEMNAWKIKNGKEVVPKEVKKKVKKKVVKKVVKKVEKGKKKINAYLFFAKRFRPLAKKMMIEKMGVSKGKELTSAVTKEIAKQWRSIDELDDTIKPELKKRLTEGEDADDVWEWFQNKLEEHDDDDEEEELFESDDE